jgi:hypothetical protein
MILIDMEMKKESCSKWLRNVVLRKIWRMGADINIKSVLIVLLTDILPISLCLLLSLFLKLLISAKYPTTNITTATGDMARIACAIDSPAN